MYGFKEIAPADLRADIDAGKKITILDVRNPGETARGIIPGAELMPLHLMPLKYTELDGDECYAIYCQGGARSAQACAYLSQQGFENIYNLQGGIVGWQRSGLPVVAPQ